MAELNFGLLNPPGSQSIGNAFVQGMDQAAAARAQENQNAMALYTLGKARREDAQQNELYNAVRQPGFKLDIGTAMRFGAPGLAAFKAQQDRDKSDVDIAYTQARTGAIPAATAKIVSETEKLQRDSRNAAIGEVASLFDFESAGAAIDTRLANKSITQAMADEMRQGLTPENFTKWKHNTLIRLSTPEQQLRQSAVTTKDTDRGGYIERQTYDAQGIAVGDPIRINKTLTPGQVQTSADAKLSRELSARQFTAGGYTYDLQAGVRYDRNGVAQPLLQQAPAAADAAPASGGVPAAPASGGVPAGRNAPGLVPVGVRLEKAPAEFTKMDNQLSNLVGNLNRFKQEIAKGKTTSAQWAPTGADTAAMNAKYIALLMGMKDMYTLGALTGPDLGLIESQISNPATWGGFTKSREAFNAQIDNVEQQLKDASINLENSYGHKPKATSAAFSRKPAASRDSPPPPPIESFRPSREKP